MAWCSWTCEGGLGAEPAGKLLLNLLLSQLRVKLDQLWRASC